MSASRSVSSSSDINVAESCRRTVVSLGRNPETTGTAEMNRCLQGRAISTSVHYEHMLIMNIPDSPRNVKPFLHSREMNPILWGIFAEVHRHH